MKKNKTLISYFPAHFPWHNQILKSVFQLIFYYTIKYQKIIHFLKIYFLKIYFSKKKILKSKQATGNSCSPLPFLGWNDITIVVLLIKQLWFILHYTPFSSFPLYCRPNWWIQLSIFYRLLASIPYCHAFTSAACALHCWV